MRLSRLVAGNRVAVDALGFLAEPFEERRAVGHFGARFGERLALLGGHQARQIVLVGHHQVEPAAQDRARVPWRSCARQTGKARDAASIASRVSTRAQARHGADDGAGRRIVDGNHLSRAGADPGAVDVAFLPKQPGILERRRPEPSAWHRSASCCDCTPAAGVPGLRRSAPRPLRLPNASSRAKIIGCSNSPRGSRSAGRDLISLAQKLARDAERHAILSASLASQADRLLVAGLRQLERRGKTTDPRLKS